MKHETDIGELIGMVIAFLVVAYTLISSVLEVMYGKKRPQKPVEEIYKEIFQEEEEEEEPEEELPVVKAPLPPPVPKAEKFREPSFEFHSKLDAFKTHSAIEDRALDVKLHTGEDLLSDKFKGVMQVKRAAESPAAQFLKSLPSKKALIIAAEIVNPPLSLRK